MSLQALDLMKSGIIQSGGGSAYTEQGVVLGGTEWLDLDAKLSADDPESIFFVSGSFSDISAQMRLMHWGEFSYSTGWIKIDHTGGDSAIGSQIRAVTDAGAIGNFSPSNATEGRVHLLATTKAVSGDILTQIAIWDSTNGWQTATDTKSSATTVYFNTSAGNFRLFANINDATPVSGTVYRAACWIGSTLDVTNSTDRDRFVSGANTVDPATSVAQYGTPEFDCYGDAATWNSGSMPVGTFTASGTFTDA